MMGKHAVLIIGSHRYFMPLSRGQGPAYVRICLMRGDITAAAHEHGPVVWHVNGNLVEAFTIAGDPE